MFQINSQLFQKAEQSIKIERDLTERDFELILEMIGEYLQRRGSAKFLSFVDAYKIGVVLATLFDPEIPINPSANLISSFILRLSNKISESDHKDKPSLLYLMGILKSNIVPLELVVQLRMNNNTIQQYACNQLKRNLGQYAVLKAMFQEIYNRTPDSQEGILELKSFTENLLALLYFAKNSIIKLEYLGPDEIDFIVKSIESHYNNNFK